MAILWIIEVKNVIICFHYFDRGCASKKIFIPVQKSFFLRDIRIRKCPRFQLSNFLRRQVGWRRATCWCSWRCSQTAESRAPWRGRWPTGGSRWRCWTWWWRHPLQTPDMSSEIQSNLLLALQEVLPQPEIWQASLNAKFSFSFI